MKYLRTPLLLLTFCYVVYGTLLAIFQEKIIYYPSAQDFDSCAPFHSAEKIKFGQTRAYYQSSGERLAVLYHGNAGSACDRYHWAATFESNGYSYLIVEYSGYSNDIQSPSHQQLKNNVQDVVSLIMSRPYSEVLVVGESIGSGPASLHASIHPPEKLLMIAPFSDLSTLAGHIYWYYPTSLMVNNAFDNKKNLQHYTGRVKIIHGSQDQIIPHSHAKQLFDSINSSDKQLILIDRAGHNDIYNFTEVSIAINNFLQTRPQDP